MDVYRSNKLENVWLIIVLIHVIGSAMTGFILGMPYGLAMFNSLFWIYCAYANRQKKAAIFLCALGWSANLYLYNSMPLNYLVPLLMNVMVFAYLLFLHYGNFTLLMQESRMKELKAKEVLSILPLTILLLILSGYVNAISMVFFENHVVNNLSNVGNELGYATFALALAPALVEELFFRGYLFHRLGNGKKAILLSAGLFALGHMNYNQICYAFVMGLFFALVFRVTDNLSMTVIIHFLFNMYTILIHAFAGNSFVQQLVGFQISGYHLFDAVLVDESGRIMTSALMAGGIISILAAILIGCILRYVLRADQGKTYKGMENESFGIPFYFGIAVCLYIAFRMK